MAEKLKCDCGHTENEYNIYSVGSWDNKMTYDLCFDCWDKTPLIETPDSSLSSWSFKNETHQSVVIK